MKTRNKIFNPLIMVILGAVLGYLAKYFDLNYYIHRYDISLGDIFSEMSIWILFGVIISIFSTTKKRAMINILTFSLSMLASYYLTAHFTHAIYGWAFIKGWTAFALISPIFAYFTWLSKEQGAFPIFLRLGIILTTIIVDIVLFGGPKIYDIVIIMVLIYLLFFVKIERT